MATGEVLFSGTQLGVEGNFGHVLASLNDADNLTFWQPYNAGGALWAGKDCGAAVTLTRVRVDMVGGYEDAAIGGVIQATNNASWPTGLPTFVQGNSSENGSANASSTAGFSIANASGNCLLIFFQWQGPSVTAVAGISDTLGNTFTPAFTAAGSQTTNAWVVPNCKGGANAVTVTTAANSSYSSLKVLEFTGVSASGPVDVAAFATGSGTGASVSMITALANDYVVAFVEAGGVTTGAGYATLYADSNFNQKVEGQQMGAAGSVTANATFASQGWGICAVALVASNVSGVATLKTFTGRLLTGTLLNEFALSPGQPYRYVRYVAPANAAYGNVANLDFIGNYATGCTASACTPTAFPPGGQYDLPTRVRLSCLTTDAALYYTLDGSTPTTGSTPYTGPIVIGSTSPQKTVLKVLATSPNASNSRIATYTYYIKSQFVSQDIPWQDNRGYRITGIDPWIWQDPVSKYWYNYLHNEDEPGVQSWGDIGSNVYRSADLKNWEFRANIIGPPAGQAIGYGTYVGEMTVLYNALNSNYVAWVRTGQATFGVYTASAPDADFTLQQSFTGLCGTGVSGAIATFVDTDGVTAYLVWDDGTGSLTIARLTSSYLNVVGTSGTYYQTFQTTLAGKNIEALHLFCNAGTYYLIYSGQTQWAPNENDYATASAVLGPYAQIGNPFQPVSGGVAGTYTDNSIAFNSQTCQVLQVPGRSGPCFIYLGDAFNTGLSSSEGTSTTANFAAYTTVMLPVAFPSSGTMSISWIAGWNLDAAFPSDNTKSPAAPTGLSLTFSAGAVNAAWTNHETNPHALFLDRADDSAISVNPASEVLTTGTAAFADSVVTPGRTYYYQVRSVNASGSSTSGVVSILAGAAGLGPPPPLTPSSGQPGLTLVIQSHFRAMRALEHQPAPAPDFVPPVWPH